MEGGWDVCEFDPMYYSEHYNTAHWWCPRLKPIHEDPVFGAPVLEFADRVGRPPMSGDDSFWEAVDQCIDQATESCGELVVLGRDWREPTGELKRQAELWHSRLRELWSAKSRELWPAQARDPRVVDVHQLWGE